ncbi:MAG: hypothetical protein V5A85_10730 [Haloarculaceae archaeon]
MGDASLWTRILRQVVSAWRTLRSVLGLGPSPDTDVHTTLTFRAVADAVVPRTPELGEELGQEHVPGGQDVGLGDFLVVYVNDLFQFGLPHLGARGNLPLAGPVANALDAAALALLERDGNADEPSRDRVEELLEAGDPTPARSADAAGTFAELSREDRLRALGILDEFEVELRAFDGELFELDAGLVGQLVIGFAEMIYYSEWQGYGEFTRPPSELAHRNDPSAVQSWRQTGYPGFAPGYAALRGYLGSDDGSLGGGEAWSTVDGDALSPVRVSRESGGFRENDYDTGDYEEPYPAEGA